MISKCQYFLLYDPKLDYSKHSVLFPLIAHSVKFISAFVIILSCPLHRLGAISHPEVFQGCLFTTLSLHSASPDRSPPSSPSSDLSGHCSSCATIQGGCFVSFKCYCLTQEHFMPFTVGQIVIQAEDQQNLICSTTHIQSTLNQTDFTCPVERLSDSTQELTGSTPFHSFCFASFLSPF